MNEINYETRLHDIERFYSLLDEQEIKVRGKRTLANCDGKMIWSKRGVYFFFEIGENRTESGKGPRVVRIGTHALKIGGKQTLWDRLRTHRGLINGRYPGGGNHRGSVFRLHVGTAIIDRDKLTGLSIEKWGVEKNEAKDVRNLEYPIERAVSNHIGKMPFLWVKVDDPAGPDSDRKIIESNAIALLSNFNAITKPIDPPSNNWLGKKAKSEKIRLSGLWNSDHVDKIYDATFLDLLEKYIKKILNLYYKDFIL